MIFGMSRGGLGAASSPVRAMQSTLARMGLPVRPTGVIDAATVAAVNGIFDDWSDVPPKLRTGRLSARDIGRQIGLVSHYVRIAAGGAMAISAG